MGEVNGSVSLGSEINLREVHNFGRQVADGILISLELGQQERGCEVPGDLVWVKLFPFWNGGME